MIDPTGTAVLRRAFLAEGNRRLGQVRSLTHMMLVEHDLMQARNEPWAQLFPQPGHRLSVFAEWFSRAANELLLSAGWWEKYLQRAYQSGTTAGGELVWTRPPPGPAPVPAVYSELARRELAGIVAALVQQVSRQAGAAALTRQMPQMMYRQVLMAIRKVGMVRLQMFVNYMTVKLHNAARLEQFRTAGIMRVGIIPELLEPPKPSRFLKRDHALHDHCWHDQKKAGSTATMVNVLTAEDNKVCFPASTLIRTFKGEQPIEQVRIEDFVLTRLGWRRVIGTSERKFQGKLVRIISEDSPPLICTANHPIWTERADFVRADQVRRSDVLQSFDDKRVKVLRIEDVGLADVADNPSKFLKRLIAALLPFRLAVPIKPVHLNAEPVSNHKVYGPASDLNLGNEWDIEAFKRLSNDSFNAGFAFEAAIARNRTKSSRLLFRGYFAKCRSALQASVKIWRAPTRFRAVSVFRPPTFLLDLPKWLLASLTDCISALHILLFASPRAKIVPAGVAAIGDSESFFAAYAGLGDRVGTTKFVASARAKQSAGNPIEARWWSGVAALSARLLRIFSRTARGHGVTVYNLQVAEQPEYFANGILVHNCAICKGIAANGPYSVDKAEGIIPAHPNCRCVFVVDVGEEVPYGLRGVEPGRQVVIKPVYQGKPISGERPPAPAPSSLTGIARAGEVPTAPRPPTPPMPRPTGLPEEIARLEIGGVTTAGLARVARMVQELTTQAKINRFLFRIVRPEDFIIAIANVPHAPNPALLISALVVLARRRGWEHLIPPAWTP